MGIVRHGIGFVSTGLLAVTLLYYPNRIKSADDARTKIDNALNSIEDEPNGAVAIAQITKELETLEKTPYGRETLKEIHDKLLALEDKSPKDKQLGVDRILSDARNKASSTVAADQVSMIGAVGATGIVTSTTWIAPLIGGLLVKLLFGEEKDGSVVLDLEKEGEPGEHRKEERLERERAERERKKTEEKPSAKERWRKLLTREVTPHHKLRPSEQAIIDAALESQKKKPPIRVRPRSRDGDSERHL